MPRASRITWDDSMSKIIFGGEACKNLPSSSAGCVFIQGLIQASNLYTLARLPDRLLNWSIKLLNVPWTKNLAKTKQNLADATRNHFTRGIGKILCRYCSTCPCCIVCVICDVMYGEWMRVYSIWYHDRMTIELTSVCRHMQLSARLYTLWSLRGLTLLIFIDVICNHFGISSRVPLQCFSV